MLSVWKHTCVYNRVVACTVCFIMETHSLNTLTHFKASGTLVYKSNLVNIISVSISNPLANITIYCVH